MTGKRNIFEEVGTPEPTASTTGRTGIIDRGTRHARGPIRVWLIVLFALVAAMIAVGGLTRLTDSGLSITEWRPVTGSLPPMGAAAWQAEFEKYQTIPEYQLQNKGMSLADFKTLYWWEWGHRQLGRLIGLVWALGFGFFLITRKIPAGWTGRLLLLGVLGGAQGAIGWWMVSSGLSGAALDVASYRLAIHLGLAFAILGVICWSVLHLARPGRDLIQARRARDPGLMKLGDILVALAFLQVLLGALVAGIDAGRNYTDWPLMAGGFLPPDPLDLTPVWRNFFENDGLVQFVHRMTGYLLVLAGLFVWARARRSARAGIRHAFGWVAAAGLVQMALGIATVMHSAPLGLGLAHQLTAVLLWVLILRARHRAQYPVAQSIQGG